MGRVRSLCVFCGSSTGLLPVYEQAAVEMGALLAAEGIRLVYGGGNVGLMGALARGCMEAGGEVIGIIPQALFDREHGHRGISRLEVVTSMHERKARMAELADGFVALPGGIGTFEELLEIMTWAQLGIHGKPIALVNVDGYFNPLLALLDNALDQGFMAQKNRNLLMVAGHPEALITMMRGMELGHPPPKSNLGV